MIDPSTLALPLADFFEPGTLALMIPIIALIIPIVVILTGHQRKMAEIIHKGNSLPQNDLESIKQELTSMRMQMNQQTIALDDLRSKTASLPQQATVQERLGSSQ
jgi:hypothetical protein